MRRLLVALVLLLAGAPALADDLRPVQVQITEREPGLFLVQWRVPRLPALRGLPEPVLPDEYRPEGERSVTEQPGGWLLRQAYRGPDLAGRTVGIRYPLYNPSLTTLFKVELLSGERFVRALPPEEESWQVPEASVGIWLSALSHANTAVLAGARHGVELGAHLLFALALILLGGAKRVLRSATAFAVGQLAAIGATTLFGRTFDPLAAEACVALAVVFLAREAFRGSGSARRTIGLAAGAGLFHGLALAGETWGELVVRVAGMDAILLLLVAAGLGLRRLIAQPAERLRPLAITLVGGFAVAVTLSASFDREVPATVEAKSSQLPGLLSGSDRAGASAPGSERLAAAVAAPVQSFLSVEPFEVRHEVLVQLREFTEELDLGSEHLEVEDQADVIRRIEEWAAARTQLTLDGDTSPGLLERSGFLVAETTGVLPRTEAVREFVSEALVGLTFVHLTAGIPEELALTWTGARFTGGIPTTIVDPESTRATVLTAEAPVMRWTNELMEDPILKVSGVAVEPTRVPVPVGSVALLALTVLLLVCSRSSVRFAASRVALAAACLVAPFAPLSVTLPGTFTGGVSQADGRRVLAGVLPNVYRAFEFREETAVYDRLAIAVTGDTLAEVYLQNRRALELEERGGARARVEAVEVIEAGEPQSLPDGGFELRAAWTVGGSVTHFGHRHFRQNRYDADVTLVPADGLWKIRSIDVIEQERVR